MSRRRIEITLLRYVPPDATLQRKLDKWHRQGYRIIATYPSELGSSFVKRVLYKMQERG